MSIEEYESEEAVFLEDSEEIGLEELVQIEGLTLLDVVKYPSTKLSKVSEFVVDFDKDRTVFIKNLLYTMKTKGASSISAPSVGALDRIILVDIDTPVVMFNPAIVSKSAETITIEESTISLPGYFYGVERSLDIELVYENELGEHIAAQASGLHAICVQHEIEILDGVTFLSKLSCVRRWFEIKKIKKFLKGGK